MTLSVLRDTVGRVIAICEALEAGDIQLAARIAHDLELDLVTELLEDAKRADRRRAA